MAMALTSSAAIPARAPAATPAAGKGLFSRILASIMASRAAEAERLVATVMQRRGLAVLDDQWQSVSGPHR